MGIRAIEWRDGALWLLDQRRLPGAETWVELSSWSEVAPAIRDMVVRGAPAIGVAAAYGLALAAQAGDDLETARAGLAASRPTAVNLFWALDRLMALPDRSFPRLLAEAHAIAEEDVAMNRAIGRNGAECVPQGASILTICNTGALATAGHGTALGIVRTAAEDGKEPHVYACETRPRQQGLRLTAWELDQEGIPFHAIADTAVAWLMRNRKIDLAVAGADRIAANGDTANKIGTYGLALLAKAHGVPFVIAAPSSTLDPSLAHGGLIPIEERAAEELTEVEGVRVAPAGTPVWNPAFDVTPGELISAIVTERGVHRPPYRFEL